MATLDTIEGTSLSLSLSFRFLICLVSHSCHHLPSFFRSLLSLLSFFLFIFALLSLYLFFLFSLFSFVLTLSLSFVYSLSHFMCVVLTQLILLIHHGKTDKNMLIWLKKGKENIIFMCITLDMIVKLFPNIDRYTFVIAFLVSV